MKLSRTNWTPWLHCLMIWGCFACLFPMDLAAQLSKNDKSGVRVGSINIQNREQSNAVSPLYLEYDYHFVLGNNEGYEMVGQLAHASFAFKRRELNQEYEHEYQTVVTQLSFLANNRSGFDIYWGAGGGFGTYNRKSKITRGELKGTNTPNSTGTFISYHATIGMGIYDNGSGVTLDFDYANWGGLFVVVGTLGYVF